MNNRVCVMAVTVLSLSARLFAQTTYFEVTDGLWENPANWSIGAVPGITNSVHVTFEGRTARITQPGAICTNLVIGYSFGETGTVCLATGTLYTVLSQLVGRNGKGTFIQSEGTTNLLGQSLNVGEAATADGRYELHGGYLGSHGAAADFNLGYNGPGVFYQTGGTLGDFGTAASSKYLFVPRAATGTGTYIMDGGEIRFTNETYVSIGHAGVGSFIQSNGTVSVKRIFNVGKEAGGRGSFALHDGSISVGQFTIGEKSAAAGTAHIQGGELITTSQGLDVGYSGTGTVWQTGGTIALYNFLYIGRSSGSRGYYYLDGGEIALTNASNHMYVGEYGNGTLIQSNGAIRVQNWFTVSRKTGSRGLYRMSGGSLDIGVNLQLGEQTDSLARFEIVGTNSVINCKAFTATVYSTLRAEIAPQGLSKINVQNQAALAGKLEVAVQQKYFNQPVTLIDAGSLNGQFVEVAPVHPLRAVDIEYQAGTGNVVLSNFRYYTGTMVSVR